MRYTKHFCLLALLMLATLCVQSQSRKVKVSCVGNSVTYGMTLGNRETTCYPHQLQLMLGDGYDVRNFGHSGATLMRHGHNPYHLLPEYRDAMNFAGDIVIIHLGLNDTDPRNYPQRGEEFVADYRCLIDSLRSVNPSAQVYICLMTPIFEGHSRYLSGTRDYHRDIQQEIRRVAAGAGVRLIDLYTPLHNHPDMFPDNLHPNAAGARILAETVYGAITSHADTPLALPEIFRNGMVLQRNAVNEVHGTAPDGYHVTVSFAGQKVSTVAEDGKWSVNLSPVNAGGPYRMQVEGRMKAGRVGIKPAPAHQSLSVDSVYMGEVWLCSGQSNMEWVNANLPTEHQPEICRTGKTDKTDGMLHLYRMKGARTVSSDEPWTDSLLRETNNLRFIQPARWQSPSRSSVADFSAIAYRVGRALADSLGCHIGLIVNAIGGSGIEAWVDRTSTEWQIPELLRVARPRDNDFLQDWVRKCISINISPSNVRLQRHPFDPCYLYESSIIPLEGLTLRGVMWYQGESNAHNIDVYKKLWSMMQTQWRKVFRSADAQPLPFYTMQLASVSGRPSWGRFRNMQRELADSDARTYLVVTHDVGEQWNVHPRRKDVQAERLAKVILNPQVSHPEVCRAVVGKGGIVTLTLTEAVEGDIAEFELCGEDGLFYAATGTLNGTTVTLHSDKVARPEKVRYAWTDFTRATLRSSSTGLLMSTFALSLN